MNKVLLVGRLVANPETKTTTNNNTRVNFTLAVRSFAKGNNNAAVFIPCVAWNNQAKFIETYLKKGNLVSVEGRIERRSFISSKTNQNTYIFNVVVENISSLGSKVENLESQNSDATAKPSISDLFPESVENNIETSQQKQENASFNDSDDVEWFNEIDKNK